MSILVCVAGAGTTFAQGPATPSPKTQFALDLPDIRSNILSLHKAARADHGSCMECYHTLHKECEKWGGGDLGLQNARAWMRQARAVRSPGEIHDAGLALAEMLLISFSYHDKANSKMAIEAESLYAATLVESPLDPTLRFEHGRSLAFAQRSEEARKEFSRFLELSQKNDPRNILARRFVREPLLAAHRIIPKIKIRLADGSTVDTERLHGTAYVMDVWASWCGPCVNSLPEFHTLLADYRSRKLGSLGLSTDRKRTKWEDALKKYSLHGAQAIDEDGTIAANIPVASIPRFIFVDVDGVVLFEGDNVKELRHAVEVAMAPRQSPDPVALSSGTAP